MGSITAINRFSLRPGVTRAEFEEFSRELDRPACLSLDEVQRFDVFIVDAARDSSGVDVIEVMTVTDWAAWERTRDSAPQLRPVVARFEELVDADSVVTYLTHHSTDQED